jgi:hypothetical protein
VAPSSAGPQAVKRTRAEEEDVDIRQTVSKDLGAGQGRDQDDTRMEADQDVRDQAVRGAPAAADMAAPAAAPSSAGTAPDAVAGARGSPSSTSGAPKQQRLDEQGEF